MKALLILFFLLFAFKLFSQKPANGTYTYAIAFAEWGGKSLGSMCTVKIKGDSIWVIQNRKSKLSGKTGDIIDKGIIVKHKSGKWIIAERKSDKNAKEIGGCSNGPRIIDFKRKRFWLC